MSMPRNSHKRQQQARRNHKRAAKGTAKRQPRMTVPKSQRIQRTINRQPQRGMPKLVQQAIARLIERHKLLTLPPPDDAQEQAA